MNVQHIILYIAAYYALKAMAGAIFGAVYIVAALQSSNLNFKKIGKSLLVSCMAALFVCSITENIISHNDIFNIVNALMMLEIIFCIMI